jgi:xanthine dehydrogenase iron-sulfur cluster and FAD-binding subunit A
VRSVVSTLELRRPRSLREALAMLRDDGPLVPLAGATDLYVALNFGTLTGTRFLDLWSLEPLRRIEMRGDVLSLGALVTYTGLTRSRLVKQRLPMLVEATSGRWRSDSEPRYDRKRRQRLSGGDTLPVFAVAEAVVVAERKG